jgi:poly(beta-D-mannuronate) lyase
LLTRRRPHDHLPLGERLSGEHAHEPHHHVQRGFRAWLSGAGLVRPVVLFVVVAALVFMAAVVVDAATGEGGSLVTRVRDGLWIGDHDDEPIISGHDGFQLPDNIDKSLPGGIIDLGNWKLTIPVGDHDDPKEIEQPKLSTFQDPRFFHVDATRTGVVFRAGVDGVTTSGSDYPRSELREMSGGGRKEASWTNKRGTHVMTLQEAITSTPKAKPEVVAAQIHDDEDDVLMVRLNGTRLIVETEDKGPIGVLDPNYVLGTRYALQITADRSGIRVTYNNARTVTYKKTGEDYYFKAGCYTQSNEDQDEPDGAYGEVVIYSLAVQHS